MEYFIIDALGPFIDPEKPPCNWSKVPFQMYEDNLDEKTSKKILDRFRKFARKAKSIGYNAVSIDDLPHMIILDFYSSSLRSRIQPFQELYSQIFSICKKNNLKIFVNFDIMYFNKEIEKHAKDDDNIISMIEGSLRLLFSSYPVDGIITRFGECDGVDVKGMFRSRQVIRTPEQANIYLKKILPLFEKKEKVWIFRTWTIGSSKAGDLMRNTSAVSCALKNIKSKNLVLSFKYGEMDFFRQMELNPNFFSCKSRMIIELQAKREYEFFGEFPYYTGWEYQDYYDKLKDNPCIKGMMVWCQTGGWNKNNRITFLSNSSPYVELNTISSIEIFNGKDADSCIVDFFKSRKHIRFFRAYNKISEKIIYPPEPKARYFKRLYIPPVIWMYWNNITINSFMSSFVRHIYERCPLITEEEFDNLYGLGISCGIENIGYIIASLKILYSSRKVLHGLISLEEYKKEVLGYEKRYSLLSFSIKSNKRSVFLKAMFLLFFRKRKQQRVIDKILLNNLLFIPFLRLYLALNKDSSPAFADKQSTPLLNILR